MHIQIDTVKAIKPGILRVSIFTTVDTPNGIFAGPSYELTILEDDIVTRIDQETTQINLEAFQRVITEQIVRLQMTGSIAVTLNEANLSWDITIETIPDTTSEQ